METKYFGAGLRALREDRQLTMLEVMKRAKRNGQNVTVDALGKYERGSYYPRVPTLAAILEALDATLTELDFAMKRAALKEALELMPDLQGDTDDISASFPDSFQKDLLHARALAADFIHKALPLVWGATSSALAIAEFGIRWGESARLRKRSEKASAQPIEEL